MPLKAKAPRPPASRVISRMRPWHLVGLHDLGNFRLAGDAAPVRDGDEHVTPHGIEAALGEPEQTPVEHLLRVFGKQPREQVELSPGLQDGGGHPASLALPPARPLPLPVDADLPRHALALHHDQAVPVHDEVVELRRLPLALDPQVVPHPDVGVVPEGPLEVVRHLPLGLVPGAAQGVRVRLRFKVLDDHGWRQCTRPSPPPTRPAASPGVGSAATHHPPTAPRRAWAG